MSETLRLVQLGSTVDYSIERMSERLSETFADYRIEVSEPLDIPKMAFDSFRNQYHSTRILAILEEYAERTEAEHVLGVARFDLFVPGMNFVFGEARCPGAAAVISTYRLKTASPGNPDLLGNRTVKEAVHEIGHMLGLRHCSTSSCVMYFSERLADTDRKEEQFCSECERRVRWLEVE